ncbi:MAG TPA: transketolase C-terminal domain-containing protein [Clostridia bacterium]|nr:transketolase C-terminal domain-containing protein [Clostridia bacterium]
MGNIEMRAVFAAELKKLMEKDERVVVVDADLAKANGTWALRNEFPDRAIDVGVAEQNMMGVAAGLSSYGFKPYIGSFSPFVSRRICDQLTLSGCYAKQNVKVIGSDPGITAELNGGTHMGLEDVGVLRSVPDLVIFEPVDAIQLEKAMPVIDAYEGMVYMRLFRKTIDDVFTPDYEFDLFKADTIKEGKDISIFASGIMVQESVKAVAMLENEGIKAELINIHTIKPIDREAIVNSVKKTGCAVTCENHNIIGGLFSAVSEVIVSEYPVPVLPVGINDTFGEVGKLPYLKNIYKLNASDIAEKCKKALGLRT